MKSLIITLLCSFCLSTTNAQSYFRQCGIQLLTKQNGLSNNTLTGIYQDKVGFLWLGTDVGLSRYDGIHFHNYNLIDKEPRALAHLYETSNNLLWSHIANLNQIACFDILIYLRYENYFMRFSVPLMFAMVILYHFIPTMSIGLICFLRFIQQNQLIASSNLCIMTYNHTR